jgi:hypothetical protein
MASLIISTIVFFIASFLIGRWADSMDFPRGMVRSVSIFVFALTVSYAVAALVDWIA